MDTHKRSILKTVTFRVVATAVTMVLVFVFTDSLVLAGSVGLLDVILKLAIYYLHERLWERISWGSKTS